MNYPTLSKYTFLSIGENCLCQEVIRRHKLKTAVGPFSWAKSNIDYAIALVQEDFKDLLNPAFLIHREMWGKSPATNIKYQCKPGIYEKSVSNGFEFSHKDVISSPEDLENMSRKTERFKEVVLGSDEPIVLVYQYRLTAAQDINYVRSKLEEFAGLIKQRRPNKEVITLFIRQNLVKNAAQRKISIVNDGQIYAAVFDVLIQWSGKDENVFGVIDDDLFGQMFSMLEKQIEQSQRVEIA